MSTQNDILAQQLEAAILADDEAGLVDVRELLSGQLHGVDLDDTVPSFALFKAARHGRVETCRLLWKTLRPSGKQKYFVSETESRNRPLHIAVEKCAHFAVGKLLVEDCHFNINQTDFAGDTPLHYVFLRHSEAMCRYLSENGAEVNRGGMMLGHGTVAFGPLCFAVEDGDRVLVDLLLEDGADPNFNRTMPATTKDNEDDSQDKSRNTDNAITRGNVGILRTLLQHGAYVGIFYRNASTDTLLSICFYKIRTRASRSNLPFVAY